MAVKVLGSVSMPAPPREPPDAATNPSFPMAGCAQANTEVLKAMTDADFAHEISILRACRDTNILQFQGACFQDNRTLLVTEYMEGGSLTHNLRAKKINWYRKGKKVRWASAAPSQPGFQCEMWSHSGMPARVQIAIDVARALVYLHTRRILHLDIKSANVLLTRWASCITRVLLDSRPC